MEGSVDEDSTKSDEEYDDLAMRDGQENGYWSDNEEEMAKEKKLTFENGPTENNSTVSAEDAEKYRQNLDLFLKLIQRFAESPCTHSLVPEKKEGSADVRARTRSLSDYSRLHSQSQHILSSGEAGLMFRGPMVSAAPPW